MALIKASLADVSTDFKPLDPGIYTFDIEKVEEVPSKDDEDTIIAYRIRNKVLEPLDSEGRVFSDYINIVTKKNEPNEVGLANLKRYFEVCFGKEEVAGWSDEDYDTDRLVGRQWKGQLDIQSYTKEGEVEPRRNNRIKAMEAA